MHGACPTSFAGVLFRLVLLVLTAGVVSTGCKGPSVAKATPLMVSLVMPKPPVVETPAVTKAEKTENNDELDLGKADIIPRAKWSLTTPIASRLEAMGKKTRITIHHEGMQKEDFSSMSEVKEQLQKVQASHCGRGYADIGYHFIIDYNGRTWEGRPLKYQGAHAGNGEANRGNIGICLMGNFEQQRPARAQLASMHRLVHFLMDRYAIDENHIYTHREVKAMYHLGDTECPGAYLQCEVDSMRKSLQAASSK
jgi:hypothetical protein